MSAYIDVVSKYPTIAMQCNKGLMVNSFVDIDDIQAVVMLLLESGAKDIRMYTRMPNGAIVIARFNRETQ